MNISDISLATIIIAVAGGVSILALMTSKFFLVLARKDVSGKNVGSKYECGFDGKVSQKFNYVTEKSFVVSLYLVLELSFVWLLACYAFHPTDNSWSGLYFIKILALIIMASMVIVYKAICAPRKFERK